MIQPVSENMVRQAASSTQHASPSPAQEWEPRPSSGPRELLIDLWDTLGGLTHHAQPGLAGAEAEGRQSLPPLGWASRLRASPCRPPPSTVLLPYLVLGTILRPGDHWFSTLAAHTGISREGCKT